MNVLFTYIIRESYAVIFSSIIIVCFMAVNKSYGKRVKSLFSALLALSLLDSVCGAIEYYLATSDVYQPGRVFLSWVCYLAAPAIILTIVEVMFRDSKTYFKWLLAIPEFINIFITSFAFFSKLVFYYDEENIFHTGVLGFVPRVTLVVYIILLIAAGFHICRKKKWETIVVFVCAVFVTFEFLNEFLVLIPVSLKGITLSLSIMTYFLYFTYIRHSDEVQKINNNFTETEEKLTNEMLDQAIETLAYTIDAKDRYTRGHSFRVAKYSRQIAALHGCDEARCREIYFAGLLHDIGKISISDTIINKNGELTQEEYDLIKNHPVTGAAILEKMVNFPTLSAGAKYHHERYDGTGYPYGIKGEEIPEMARIIAVADAYDTMTSHRAYRESMDQAYVKQEIWKGMGTQFDPHFAKVMISLIDADVNFDMREKPGDNDGILHDVADEKVVWPVPNPQRRGINSFKITERELKYFGEMVACSPSWGKAGKFIHITPRDAEMKFVSQTIKEDSYLWNAPTILVYYSKDGKLAGPDYEELAVFMSAGHSWQTAPALRAKSIFTKTDRFESWDNWIKRNHEGMNYRITVRREKNMVYIKLMNELMCLDGFVRVPEDYGRELYLTVSGDYCKINDVIIED